MARTTINELSQRYDLELNKILEEIKENNAKNVVLQFPDGLKQYANIIVDYLRENTDANILIWLGSCYGACDYPIHLENLKGDEKIDLVIQFGHNAKMPDY